MHVLVVGLNYAPEATGIAPYTTGLASALRRRGHEVSVITGFPHYPAWRVSPGYSGFSRDERINGVPVRRVRHYVPRSPRLGNRLLMELSFGVHAALTRWHRADVVVAVSPALFSSWIVMLRARLIGARRVIWVQDLYGAGVAETGHAGAGAAAAVAAFERRTFRRADRVVVIHNRFRRHLVDALGIDGERIDVVRNWSHVESAVVPDRAAVRQRMGWAPDEFIVLHAGNMGAKQGLENVIEAARLSAARGSRARFVLLGDGSRRPALHALADSLGPCSKLSMLAPLPERDFLRIIASADLLLVNERPGLAEMCVPSKLTTYFSAGLPVLAATDLGSVTAEEIAASGGGVRVDAGDPEALLEGAERLADDPELRARLGARGRNFRAGHLSEEAAVDGFLVALSR